MRKFFLKKTTKKELNNKIEKRSKSGDTSTGVDVSPPRATVSSITASFSQGGAVGQSDMATSNKLTNSKGSSFMLSYIWLTSQV